MKKYAKEIDRLIENNDGELISNCSIEHAVVLLRKFFQHAKTRVRIFSGNLSYSAYKDNELIEEVEIFLGTGGKLEVVVEDDIEDNNSMLQFIEEFPSNVNLFRLDATRLEKEPNFHFAIVDDNGYRFEGDKTKTVAIASFGDMDFTMKLGKSFDVLKECSNPYKEKTV